MICFDIRFKIVVFIFFIQFNCNFFFIVYISQNVLLYGAAIVLERKTILNLALKTDLKILIFFKYFLFSNSIEICLFIVYMIVNALSHGVASVYVRKSNLNHRITSELKMSSFFCYFFLNSIEMVLFIVYII